ncbi:MAG: RES family NAD+ phosphorylase [Bacteroidota bacterium]|nr:RES family NAD+ phosphorylase [Bacteroidota bacterium]
MLVYRIVHKKFSTTLFVSGIRGRWNSAGNKVLYCAESIPLAFLENMVRRKGVGFNDDFKIMILEIPDDIEITFIKADDMKAGWRNYTDYSQCQAPGDLWYNEGKTLILKVPSAILSTVYNFIINTNHTEYKRVKLVEITNLVPDERIEEILKKYQK